MRIFFSAVTLVFCGALSSLAQGERSEIVTVFRFDPVAFSTIVRAFQGGDGPRAFQTYAGDSFIFPVKAGSETICTFRPNGQFDCRPIVYYERCPSEIPVDVPGSDTTVTIPVTCTGPDQHGNCTCEVREER